MKTTTSHFDLDSTPIGVTAITFEDCVINRNIYIEARDTINEINFDDSFLNYTSLSIKNPTNKVIDLTKIKENSHSILTLHNYLLDKIDLNYQQFYARPYAIRRNDNNLIFHQKLMEKLKAENKIFGYKKLYREFQHKKLIQKSLLFKPICGLQEIWWNWGDNKELIILHTAIGFLYFLIFNYILFPKLALNTYVVPNIKNAYIPKGSKSWLKQVFNKNIYLAFYYTVLIFFGLKMTNENFNYAAENRKYVIYIYVQYLFGLICLAFLANYVIQS